MSDLTREQITEWLRLAEAATPGPWEWDDDKHEAIYGPMDFEERWAVIDIGFVPGNPEPNLFLRDNDADFILAARAAVPALCRALLDAWGYKAEAMAARELVNREGVSRIGNSSVDARRYAEARAANEAGEGRE